MEKLHINFYELSKDAQQEMSELIMNNYLISAKKNKSDAHTIDRGIQHLFSLNNAGIDIDIFPYMTYDKLNS